MDNELIDANLRIVSADIRRRLLEVLRHEDDGETTLGTLVDHLLSGRELGTERRERLRLELHHDHLPRLDEQGLVDYDQARNRIRYESDPTIDRMLDTLTREIPQTVR